ncbi:MAG: EMC3/TMCO1 family protein [Candidatus Micrarchaeia archaeon]
MINIFLIELVTAGIFYAIFAIIVQRRLSNIDKMYELRAKMNKSTKELMELTKSNATKDKISTKQKELTDASMSSMKLQMKPMLIIFPIFAVVYYLLVPMGFSKSGILVNLLGFTLNYQLLFIVVTFVSGICLSIIFSLRDRKRLKDKYNFGLMQPSFKEDTIVARTQEAQ